MRSATSGVKIAGLVAAAGLSVGLVDRAGAQVWDGGGADNNFTTAANWSPDAVPANNGTATLLFGGLVRLGPVVNSAFDVAGINFLNNAGAFTISGASALTIRGSGILNSGANTQTVAASIVIASNQTWTSSAGPLAFTSPSVAVSGGSLTINAVSPVTLSAALSGPRALNKTGSGTVTVNVNGTLVGPTTIQSGTWRLGASNVMSDTSIVTVDGDGTLDLNGQSETIPMLTGASSLARIVFGGGSLVAGISSAGTFPFAGTLTGTGNFTKGGPWVLLLQGDNTLVGTYTVTGGTLQIGANDRIANSSDLVVNGGTFDLNGFTETVNQVTLTAGFLQNSGGTLIANGFDVQSGNITCKLSGPGSLVKSGGATNVLMNASGSSYLGATVINGGTLATNALFGALPPTTDVTVASGATLQLLNFNESVRRIGGTGTINVVNASISVGNGNASCVFPGVITDGGASVGGLIKVGTGSLTLSGSSTYTGTTLVSAGLLHLSADERLSDSSTLIVNGGDFVCQTETLGGVTLSIGSMSGTSLHAPYYSLLAGDVFVPLSGPGAVIKDGAGVVTMHSSGTQSQTLINAGVLVIDSESQLGVAGGLLSLSGGTLRIMAPTTITRPVFLGASSTVECLADVIMSGWNQAGTAGLSKTGAGMLTFQGQVSGIGTIGVNGGTVRTTPTTTWQGAGFSVGATGDAWFDQSLISLTGSVNNLGVIRMERGTRLSATTVANNGIIGGSGLINASLTNNSTGDIRVGDGEQLRFTGTATQTNAGLIEAIGGEIEFVGPVTNSGSTGMFVARNATMRFDAGLTNFGSVATSFGATDVFGDIDNRAGGSIVVSGLGNVTFVDDVVNNGVLRTSSGSTSVFFGSVSGAGSFPGTGTVFMEGDLRPGNSPAVVEFGGDLILGGGARTEVELAAPTVFDRVIVDGDVELDGTLDIRLINGYFPSGVGTYSIVHAGHRVGQFAQVLLPASVRGMVVRYTSTDVVLSYCSADFNSDGLANSQDFFDYLGAFFASSPIADFNHSGTVNSQDFFDYLAAFFTGCN